MSELRQWIHVLDGLPMIDEDTGDPMMWWSILTTVHELANVVTVVNGTSGVSMDRLEGGVSYGHTNLHQGCVPSSRD